MPTVLLADDAILFKVFEATVLRRRACRLLKAPAERLAAAAAASGPDLIVLAISGASQARLLDAIASARSLSRIPILALDLRAAGRRARAGRTPSRRRSSPVVVLPVGPGFDSGPADEAESIVEETLRSLIGLSARGLDRMPAGLPVRFRSRTGSFVARTKDVSEGGLFLKTPQRLARGERVDLRVSLPGAAAPASAGRDERRRTVTASGRVVRLVGPEESDLIPGAGVRFTHMEASDREALRRFLLGTPGGGAGARHGARAAG